MYIFFAVFALFSSVGNTIFNRVSSHKVGTILSATIKSFFISFVCLLICAIFGHTNTLFSLSKEQVIWILVLGLVTVVDWVFYFLGLKNSYLEAFASFEASAILFFSNLLFSIFMINVVTVTGSSTNIILYYLGLAFVLASMLYATLNKKINPVSKKWWILCSVVSTFSLALTLVITKIKLNAVPTDVIAFYQMFIVFIACLILLLFSKEIKQVHTLKSKTFVNFFISAILNGLMMITRYQALSYSDSNPSIVSIIVGLDFVFVSVATVIFFKANNKKQLLVLISLIVLGMILSSMPALLK